MKLAVVSTLLILTGVYAQESEDIRNVMLDQEFSIKIGQRVEVKKEELQIRFTSILKDSRCSKGEQCVTQGNVKIGLELRQEKGNPVSVPLNTTSRPTEADYEGYPIRLIELNPYPSKIKEVV